LDSVYFVNSGSEATEGAMKLAKRFTGRGEFVSCFNAYHGSTQGAASLMNPTDFTQPFHPLLPGISSIRFNEKSDLSKITHRTAAVIIETVAAESGVHAPQDDYLKALRKRCDETGALLILDEIQVGFGRTGTLFAFEQYGIAPDIFLLAKGMGGGMPIGAFIANKTVMDCFTHSPVLGHITTFGGHPVSCAAALATLQTLLTTSYIREVEEKAALFVTYLQHPAIRTIRHKGLLMAVELSDFNAVQKVIQFAIKNGVITDWFLFNSHCLRIAPPLTISKAEIKTACEVLLQAFDKV
jgi:acetylornithine/succinyldiaminopimelate/putrescine aminotransferase